MREKRIHGILPLLLFLLGFVLLQAGKPRAWAGESALLGMSAAFTGPSRGLGIELYRGSMAYFAFLNESGGINGKRVDIVPLDDGYQPDPAVENTIKFLEDENILCLFNYVGTPTVTRILPLLKGYKGYQKLLFFPFSGAEPQRQFPYKNYVFNLRASYTNELDGLVEKFLNNGMTRLAVFYQIDAYGRSGWDGARKALAARHRVLAGEATYKRGAQFTDSMKQQVEILMRSKPDAVLSIGSYAACAAFIRDARNMGLDVPIANVSFVGSENLLALLEKAGAETGRDYTENLVNTQVVPSYEDLSLPAVREYRECMDMYAPPPPSLSDGSYQLLKYSFTSFEGFLNAKVMAHILASYEAAPTSGMQWAAEFTRDTELGIDVSVNLSPANHQGLEKVYFTTVKDGKFIPLDKELWRTWRR
ncbi:ABC transporter substrate-binding protein [uncultured Pseudodesulfovibrio sp.]|uniref:ABC transporter substrate-binding protein n=1 Tax=uncultured Pseudodesulfovibrio sp. TaxID=2035858 RepID=UPI0029C71E33|nr:ABC transporter substrate-binding protein [uncultured Pseudodesulfovibrio sp.]